MALAIALLSMGLPRPATPNVAHEREGFFLRLAAGPGYLTGSSPDVDATLSGAGLAVDVAIGGTVARNLILYGFIGGHYAEDVEYSTSIRPELAPVGRLNAFAGEIGAGLSWYVMPANVHLSGGLGTTTLTVEYDDGGGVLGTERGIGYHGLLGKEWWIGREWALKAAIRVLGGFHMEADTIGLGREKDAWKFFAIAALLTATYN